VIAFPKKCEKTDD